jgi:hypothetical protein
MGSVELKFFFSKDRFRTDVDMTLYKNFEYPVSEELKENWRKHGMAEAVTIYNLSKGEVWDIRPKQRGAFGRSLTRKKRNNSLPGPFPLKSRLAGKSLMATPAQNTALPFKRKRKNLESAFGSCMNGLWRVSFGGQTI